MKDKKRINRILKKLKVIWNKVPEQRFGQLLFNYTNIVQSPYNDKGEMIIGVMNDPFYVEDEKFEESLNQIIKDNNLK